MALKYAALFVIVLAGCNEVPRPNTTFCLTNVKLLEQICYNLAKDYDDNGNLKQDAHPLIIDYPNAEAMLESMDKNFSTDPIGWANLKSYMRDLRASNP